MSDGQPASTSPNGSPTRHADAQHSASNSSDQSSSNNMLSVDKRHTTALDAEIISPQPQDSSNQSDDQAQKLDTTDNASTTSTANNTSTSENNTQTHKAEYNQGVEATSDASQPSQLQLPRESSSRPPVLISSPPPPRKASQAAAFGSNIPIDAPRQRFIPPPRPASTRNIPLPPRSPRSPAFPPQASLLSMPSPPLSPPSQLGREGGSQAESPGGGSSSLMNVPPLNTRGGPGLPPPHIPDDVGIVSPPSYAPPPPPQHLLAKNPLRQLQSRPSTAPGGSRNAMSTMVSSLQPAPSDIRSSMVPTATADSTAAVVAALNMQSRPVVPSRHSSIKKGSPQQRPATAQPANHSSNASTHTIPLAIPPSLAPPSSPPSQPIPPIPIAQNNSIYTLPSKSRASLATQRSRPISDVSAVLPPAFSMDGLPDPALFMRAADQPDLPREAIVDARRETIKRFEEQKRKEEEKKLQEQKKMEEQTGTMSPTESSTQPASTSALPSTDPTTVTDGLDQGFNREQEVSTSSSAANEASLEMVLSDPILLRAFEGFLVNHISEESLIFLKALWQCRKDCALATAQAAQAAAFANEAEEEATKAEETAAQVASELDELREKEQPSISSVLDDRKESLASQASGESPQNRGNPYGSQRPSSGGFFQSAALLEAMNKQRHAEAFANEKTAAASAAIADAQNIAKINAGLMEWNIKRMISHFIHPTSPMEVQITPQCRRELLQKIEKTVSTWDEHVLSLFDDAEQQIMRQLRARVGDFNREIDWELNDMYIRSGPKSNQKRVLIIGGGFCGQSVASTLDKMPRFHVTLVDNKDYWEYTPAIVKMIVDPQASHVRVPHQNYVRNGTVLIGNVDEIRSDCAILAPRRVIPFHYCVIATGSSYTSQMKTATVSTSYRAKRLYLEYQSLRRANVVLVVGGGLVGVEIATIIAADFPGKRVTIVEANARLLKRTGPLVHEKVMRRMRQLNIEVVLNERIIESSADRKRFKSDKGRIYECDKVYIATGQIARGQLMRGSLNRIAASRNGQNSPRLPLSPTFSKSPEANRSSASRMPLPNREQAEIFASYLDDTGRIKVESSLQLKYHPHIFAGGDVSARKDEKTFQGAIFCGVTIARNICRLEKGLTPVAQGSKGTRLYSARPIGQTIYLGDNMGLYIYKFKYAFMSKQFYSFREFLERWIVGTVSNGNNVSLYFGKGPSTLGSVEASSKRKLVPNFTSRKTKTVLPDNQAEEHTDFDGITAEDSTDSVGDMDHAKAALGIAQIDLTGVEDDDGSNSTHTGSSLGGDKLESTGTTFGISKFKTGKSGKALKNLQIMFQEASKASSKFANVQGHVMTAQETRYTDAADHLEIDQGIIEPDDANATNMSSNETTESWDSMHGSTSASSVSPPLTVQQKALHTSMPISRSAPGPIPAKAALLLGVIPKPRKDQMFMSPPSSSAGVHQQMHLAPQPSTVLRHSLPPPPVPPKDPGYNVGSLPETSQFSKLASPRSSTSDEVQSHDVNKSSTSLHSHMSSEAAVDGQSNPDRSSGPTTGHTRRQGSTSSSLFTWSDKPAVVDGSDLPSPVPEDAVSQQRSPRNVSGIPGKAAHLLGIVDRPTSSASERAQETLAQEMSTPDLASEDEDDVSYDGSWDQEAATRDFDFSYFDENEMARGRASSTSAIQERVHNRRGSHSSTASSRNGIPAKAVAILGVHDTQAAPPPSRKNIRSMSVADMQSTQPMSRYGGPVLPPSTVDTSLSIDVSNFGLDTPTIQLHPQQHDSKDNSPSPSTPISADQSRASALSSISTGTNETVRPSTIRSTSAYSLLIDPSFLTPDSGISEGLLNAIRLMEQADQEEHTESGGEQVEHEMVAHDAPLSPLREEPPEEDTAEQDTDEAESTKIASSGSLASPSAHEDTEETLSESSAGPPTNSDLEQTMEPSRNISTSTIDDILSDTPRKVKKSSKAAALLGLDSDTVAASPANLLNQRTMTEQPSGKPIMKYVPLMQAASGNQSDASIDSPSSKPSSPFADSAPLHPPPKTSPSTYKSRAASPSIGSAGQFFKSLGRRGNNHQEAEQHEDDAYGGIATVSPSSDTLRKQSMVTPWELQDDRQVSRDGRNERTGLQDSNAQISEPRLGSSSGSQGWGMGPMSGGIGSSPGVGGLHHQPSSHGGGTVGKLFTKQLAKARLSSVTTRPSSSHHDSSMQ